MQSRVRTTENGQRKNYRFKRVKTIDSELSLVKHESAEQGIRRRIRTVISKTDNYLENQMNFPSASKIEISDSPNKTPRRIDRYDEEDQNLTTDFVNQWSRMNSIKRQTYSKLRNKFVKKFPSFREKYKKEDLNEQQIETNKASTKRSSSLNRTHLNDQMQMTLQPSSITVKNGILKVACFYSRSQKKCLYNSFTQEPNIQQEKEVPVPKMTYLHYMKNHKDHNILKRKKIKGQNLTKARQNILKLEKQGTKSFNNLKKCLDQSIEAFIRGS